MNPPRRFCLFLITSCLLVMPDQIVHAQSGWKQHDMDRPRPPVVTPAPAAAPVPPPSDAIVLFDGTDLSAWEAHVGGPGAWTIAGDYMEVNRRSGRPAPWKVGDGYFEVVPGSGDIRTRQAFGDIQLHLEWAAPEVVEGDGQGRGNSGVFLMGLYEVQILDSYDNPTYADGQAAAVYGQYPPLANAMRPPGQWQAYDIVFRRPRFGEAGQLLEPARITVFHNGVLVQDAVPLFGVTMWLQHLPYRPHADRLPLVLQDHGNPVRFRNIWVRELPETTPGAPAVAYPAGITLPAGVLDRYVGRYGSWEVRRDGDVLRMHFFGPLWLELVPLSTTRFTLKHTAGMLDFDLDEEGTPRRVTFTLGGVPMPAERTE
ncbi:MAG: hypothetical protein KatS3mg043_1786 [Rhodothermaceae bacterium]|nr:MAG: hypothetical protein KatS3mg043_1786 [Rhodothermaceae bacterium]